MKLIPLTRGKFTKVDDADFEWLSKWKWYAHEDKNGRTWYAKRSTYPNGKQVVIAMHRALLGLEFGDKRVGDHKNGDGLDNQRINLCIGTPRTNCLNRPCHRKGKIPGVDKHGPSWTVYVGGFPTKELAQKARNLLEQTFFGVSV